VFVFYIGSSCNRNSSKNPARSIDQPEKQRQTNVNFHFVIPSNNEIFKLGSIINLQVAMSDTTLGPDSIQFLIDGKQIGSIKSSLETYKLNTNQLKLGTRIAQAIGYYKNNRREVNNISFKIVASSPPKLYNYKIINTYPHDIGAFTQGLIFEDGFLFEGTGEYGHSTLRKERLNTGEKVLQLNNPSDVFGEGITAFDHKIIQITWKEKVAYIYDIATFHMINKINYPMQEGWGITYNGKNLIMSDGSASLYFLNKDDMSQIDHVIEVCDDQGPVEKLNELEFIEGEVWANVWETDYIVRINPENGEVTGKIDLTGLLKPKERRPPVDVLNGIAYDVKTKRILVTGKNWPKLFEIAVIQK